MATVIEVPPVLARNAVGAWRDDGRRWVTALPDLVEQALRRWRLQLDHPYDMTFHWVAAVRTDDGTPAVLKLAVPGSDHQAVEAAALRAWGGRGAVELLAQDLDSGAVLLRQARPGRLLRELVPRRDEEATAVAADTMRRLHGSPVPEHGVPRLERVRSSFVRYLTEHAGDDPLPRPLVQRALGLFDELTASSTTSALMHGDLHHDNVLSDEESERGWVAIDPHGWIGDPGFDVGPLLYNPDPGDRSKELLGLVPARVDQLANQLGMEHDRVVAWGFAAAVLSEVWSTEDSMDYAPTRALDVALLLGRQLP